MDRRRFLLGAISVPPMLAFLSSGLASAATAPDTRFMKISAVLIGRKDLSPEVAQRIEDLLKKRVPNYAQQVEQLALALAPAMSDLSARAATIKGLSPKDTDFALEIAKPWYLGYVGTPSGSIMKDDAIFVTYLDAQAYDVVLKDLPRTSYPPGGSGWWEAVPDGVTSPAMPGRITDWNWQPDGATGAIAKPDPAWRAYAMGDYATLEAARAALAHPGRAPGASATHH